MLSLKRVPEATKQTVKVAGWVFVSAGLMAVVTYLLGKPELIGYYGVLNIVLFWIKELSKEVEKQK